MSLRREFGGFIARQHPFESLELVESADLTPEERESVPPTWIDIADLDGHDAVEAALAIWEAALPGRFPGTVANLRERGLDVFLGRAQIQGFDESQSRTPLTLGSTDATDSCPRNPSHFLPSGTD